jgi:hypothetical protein
MPFCQLSHAVSILMFHDSVILRLPQILVCADRISGKDKMIREVPFKARETVHTEEWL